MQLRDHLQLTDIFLNFLENRQASADEDDVHLPAGKLVDEGSTDATGATGHNWNEISSI